MPVFSTLPRKFNFKATFVVKTYLKIRLIASPTSFPPWTHQVLNLKEELSLTDIYKLNKFINFVS